MATITIEIPEELSALLQSIAVIGLPAHIYRYVLNFISSQPPHKEIASFKPTAEMADRLCEIVQKERAGIISRVEKEELTGHHKIEHITRMMKIGASLHYLAAENEC